MGLKFGSTDITAVYLGSTSVTALYLGAAEVWTSAPALTAPTLTWDTASSDNTPQFTVTMTTTPLAGDSSEVQYDTDPAFTSVSSTSDNVDAGEVASSANTFSVGPLADGTWYTRARHVRGATVSDWSDPPVEVTISTVALDLDFTTATYTGATPTATRAQTVTSYARTAAGALTSFAADTLRRTDFGLLVEPAATNLALQSDTIDNATWSKTNVTVTANSGAAPDGTTTADTITESTIDAVHRVFQPETIVSGTTYIAEAYAQNIDGRYFQLTLNTQSVSDQYFMARFDLQTGTVSFSQGNNSGVLIGSGIEALASGWYRCWVIGNLPTTSAYLLAGMAGDATRLGAGGRGSDSYLGTSRAIRVWGVDLKAASSVTSHIPTTTASVTRNADNVSFTIPSGVSQLTYTFDDDSTQLVTGVSAGSYSIPTNLNRRYIKRIVGA